MRGYTEASYADYAVLRQNFAALSVLTDIEPHQLVNEEVEREYAQTLVDVLRTIRAINQRACGPEQGGEGKPVVDDGFLRGLLGG